MTGKPGELVFIRHGKAEPLEAAADDASRRLTKAGIMGIKKMIPGLKANLDSDPKCSLWSSSLARSFQTAQVIADCLDIRETIRYDWIGNGDFTGLQMEIKKEPADSILIVGHEPYLSDWSRRISGFALPFQKGTAIGYRITSYDPLRAEPIWILPSDTVRMQDLIIRKSQPALQEFQKILRFYYMKILRIQRMFFMAPDDPETVHELRVDIRAFRSLLAFLRPLLHQERYFSMQEGLRKLSQKFAYLRELDVLEEELAKLLSVHPELEGDAAPLRNVLREERAAEQSVVSKRETEAISPFLLDLFIWLNRSWVETCGEEGLYGKIGLEEPSFEEYVNKRYVHWKKKYTAGLRKTDFTSLPAIHALRIRFKKLRYVLACLNPLLSLEDDTTLEDIRLVQDFLGTVCDSGRNRTILKELNEKYNQAALYYGSGILNGHQIRFSDERLNMLKKYKIGKRGIAK